MELKITIVSKSFASRATYYENLSSYEKQITISQTWPSMDKYDICVIPCDNSWGFAPKQSKDMLESLSENLEDEIRAYIGKYYFGEQPRGTSFLYPWKGVSKSAASKSPRFVCWSCLNRVGTTLPDDFAYSSIWSVLCLVNLHNLQLKEKKKSKDKDESDKDKKIKSIIIPDLAEYCPDSEEQKVKDAATQVSLAIKNWLSEDKGVDSVKSGELRHKQISRGALTSKAEIEQDLEALLWTRELDKRGLCSQEELEILIDWVNQNGPKTFSSAEALCGLLKRPDTEFSLTQKVISERVMSPGGCLINLLNLGTEGKLKVHDEIKRKDIVVEEKIGSGNAGTVFKGSWNGVPVAIKEFEHSALDDKEFYKEVAMLSLVKNPKLVVACYGACTSADDRFIVEELMEASLYDLLHTDSFELDELLRVDFAHQCAMAMSFLHNCGLIHRDLKSLNLLVGKKFELKICDFGLSRAMDKQKTMTMGVGTASWIAPEVFLKKSYSEKADVYSFGIIMWELLTRRIPFEDVESFSIPLVVTKGERPPIPKDCNKDYRAIMVKCWDARPNKRPGFDVIQRTLSKMKADVKAEYLRNSSSAKLTSRELHYVRKGKTRTFKVVTSHSSTLHEREATSDDSNSINNSQSGVDDFTTTSHTSSGSRKKSSKSNRLSLMFIPKEHSAPTTPTLLTPKTTKSSQHIPTASSKQ
eukprot:TRINITY_DN10466_c0_g1_i1.p1 TRINITY_DN10466_c0_g1~~TRINITY_DN10466_c0_g1_i1.p1  ORF type:complete len:697 (+),score=155.01 TRINITY_DN10466_c0_g1_i1:34-2124(+)